MPAPALVSWVRIVDYEYRIEVTDSVRMPPRRSQRTPASSQAVYNAYSKQKGIIMENRLGALLVRNLLEVFNELDEGKRLATIKTLYTPSAVFYEADEDEPIRGHERINETVTKLLRSLPPDAVFRVIGTPTGNHNLARMTWKLESAGAVLASGMDVGIFSDGQISALYLFIDPPSSAQ